MEAIECRVPQQHMLVGDRLLSLTVSPVMALHAHAIACPLGNIPLDRCNSAY
eukprot:m.1650794 g.1650794  ORF g.1650794 m.1650794 type:complete len:52 (-) comp88361_c0_seq1:183-338(-)